jgi:predicted glycosyltransferase
VVLPRTPEQGARIRALGLPALVVPEHAVDGHSLLAGADLVVSAGGTMNREAVVLGTPVYTTFAGRLGGVDERLVAEGRLRPLERADDLVIERKSGTVAERLRRDPDHLLALALTGLAPG